MGIFKTGDYVKITRKAEKHECRVLLNWMDRMDDSIGATGQVSAYDFERDSYRVHTNIGSWYYPQEVLEFVETPDIQLGDQVLIKRGKLDNDHVVWLKSMLDNVGKVGVAELTKSGGIQVGVAGSRFIYPLDALEKINSMTNIIKDDLVVFPQNISKEDGRSVGWVPQFASMEGKEGTVISVHSSFAYVDVPGLSRVAYPLSSIVKKLEMKTTVVKELSPRDLYMKLQTEVLLNEEDYVELTGLASDKQFGWEGSWDSDLDEDMIGEEAIIVSRSATRGYSIVLLSELEDEGDIDNCNQYEVPFFCVKKIDTPSVTTIKLTDDYSAVVTADNVKVGCQTIEHKTVERLYNLVKKHLA